MEIKNFSNYQRHLTIFGCKAYEEYQEQLLKIENEKIELFLSNDGNF